MSVQCKILIELLKREVREVEMGKYVNVNDLFIRAGKS